MKRFALRNARFGGSTFNGHRERVEEIRKWRERKGGKPGSPWLLSPVQRDRSALSSRDVQWFDRLKASGWTAQLNRWE
ncbi:MAG: hypothetical protein ABMA14_17820 [Hyphomonadaceae bacterium]